MLCTYGCRRSTGLPRAQARPLATQLAIIKLLATAGPDWQTPRPPYEVVFQWHACAITKFADPADDAAPWEELCAALGSSALPTGLEAAIGSMAAGEAARFVIPVDLLEGASRGSDEPWARVRAEASLARHARVHVCVRLTSFTEVRDMTGDGRVRFVVLLPQLTLATCCALAVIGGTRWPQIAVACRPSRLVCLAHTHLSLTPFWA
jgi:hypothetical protein